jgi:hypothetical protein
MDNIERLITDLRDEGYVTRIKSDYNDETGWSVRLVDEQNNTLLDRDGDRYLIGRGDSLSDSVVELNKLCA